MDNESISWARPRFVTFLIAKTIGWTKDPMAMLERWKGEDAA